MFGVTGYGRVENWEVEREGEAVRKLDTAEGSASPCACLEACLSSDITAGAGTSAFPDVYCIVWLESACPIFYQFKNVCNSY